jgi:hypothetical protein
MQTAAALFEDLRRRVLKELAEPPHISSDGSPAILYDRPKLRAACVALTAEASNKELDLVTCRQIDTLCNAFRR